MAWPGDISRKMSLNPTPNFSPNNTQTIRNRKFGNIGKIKNANSWRTALISSEQYGMARTCL